MNRGLVIEYRNNDKPTYVCARCKAVCCVLMEVPLTHSWTLSTDAVEEPVHLRRRVVGTRLMADNVPEDCDEEIAQSVMRS